LTLAQRGPSSRWTVLAVALAVQTATSIVAAAMAVMLPFVKDEFGLSFAQAGLVANFSFVGSFLAIALAGLAVDALGDRFVMVLGGIVAGTFAMAAALAQSLWVLLVLLLLMGAGISMPTPAGSVAVRNAFPLRLRGSVMSIRQTGIPLGGFFAALLLPPIALVSGWRVGMAVAGAIAVAVAAAGLAIYRAAARPGAVEGEGRGFRHVMNRDSTVAAVGGVFLVGAQMSILTYLVAFLIHDRGLPLSLAAAFLAASQLAGAGGRILWGVVSDRLLGGGRRTALLLAAATGATGSLVLAALPAATPLPLLVAAIVACAVGAVGWNGVQISFLSELARPGTEGRSVGIALMIQQPGILAGPFLFGLVADATGSFRLAWLLQAGYLATAMAIMAATHERPRAAERQVA
jgi:MFS family permease